MVSKKLLVVLSAPSVPTIVMEAEPLAFVLGVKVSVSAAFVLLTMLVEVIATITRFVSEEIAVTTRLLLAVSVSIKLITAVVLVVASSRIVFATMPENVGASLTGVTPMLNVFVTESLPPLVTPPLSFITTVIVFVPIELVAVRKVNVPFVLIAGAVANAKFVPDVTVNIHVWLDSFVGPLLMPAIKLAFVIVPASSATMRRLVITVKSGASFTAVTVRRKLFVLLSAPSVPTSVMLTLPFALVLGVNVRVIAAFVPLTMFVEVIATVAMFVSDDVAVTTKLRLAVSLSITLITAVLLVMASSRIVLETTPKKVGASLAEITPMLKGFWLESAPPPVTPPGALITTVIVFVPMALVAERKVSVPLVLMAGAVAKLKFVPGVTVKAHVWAA